MSPKISTGAIMKNPEMLKLVPDHLKTNKPPGTNGHPDKK